MKARDTDLWSERTEILAQTRHLILEKFNILGLCAKLSKDAMAKPAETSRRRLIRSERSLPPEEGGRGSISGMIARRMALTLDPKIELRAAKLKQRLKSR